MNLGDRLREERERLGYTQPAFAEVAGAKKHAQINWEKGAAFPNAAALEAWSKVGLDVLYVVTGQRSQPVPAQALLPEGDRILLDNFHAAPAQVQAGVKTALGAFSNVAGAKRAKAG